MAPSAQAQTKIALYSFIGGADGDSPSGLVRDENGNLYGTTFRGGTAPTPECPSGSGTVVEITSTGKEKVLYRFTGNPDGANPVGLVRDAIRDENGNLYGTTFGGMHSQLARRRQDPSSFATAETLGGNNTCL